MKVSRVRALYILLAALWWIPSFAQSYPARAVRVIVPFAPGGGTDILVRTIAPRLSEALGQQLVIDNRAGGGSTIGSELAAKSPPDGYTLLAV
ncbi:MAG TPA: tripartite tricarboxylate transporter substrate-binding protein, partial [Burkholderiales bacterium]|nr:tripartite tricarboxylate transporter substrate-binding protein [Burkholderiales bacterium]